MWTRVGFQRRRCAHLAASADQLFPSADRKAGTADHRRPAAAAGQPAAGLERTGYDADGTDPRVEAKVCRQVDPLDS